MKDIKIIEKCLKIVFSKHIFIVPFSGNLTEKKKTEICERVQHTALEKLEKDLPIEKLKIFVFHNLYGRVEKNLTIEDRGERFSMHAKGWSSSNMPKTQLVMVD